MPPLFPVDIRGADRPGQSALPLVDHSEFGDLKFPAPECLLMVQGYLALGPSAGAPCCYESPILLEFPEGAYHSMESRNPSTPAECSLLTVRRMHSPGALGMAF